MTWSSTAQSIYVTGKRIQQLQGSAPLFYIICQYNGYVFIYMYLFCIRYHSALTHEKFSSLISTRLILIFFCCELLCQIKYIRMTMQHWMTWQEVLSQAYEYEEKAARQMKRQNSNRQAIPAPVIVKSTNPGYESS